MASFSFLLLSFYVASVLSWESIWRTNTLLDKYQKSDMLRSIESAQKQLQTRADEVTKTRLDNWMKQSRSRTKNRMFHKIENAVLIHKEKFLFIATSFNIACHNNSTERQNINCEESKRTAGAMFR